jgi:probable F420-dependent oxidoreductase
MNRRSTTTVKFGVSTFITDQGIAPAALGRAVEERGFDSLLIAEHSHIPASRRSPYPGGGDLPEMYYRTLDPFVALGAAASVTERLLLGTGVALVAQRDPIHTAKEVATLDLVSGGRAVFGVGVGWNREEMEDHGTDPVTRGRLVDERLAAMQQLWTQEKAEFHGEFVDFDPAYAWPKPVQEPHPPIYVGGGPGAFPRIARFGDAWLANRVAPADMGAQIAQMRETAGREVPVTVYAAPQDDETIVYLPTRTEGRTLEILDSLAETADKHR